MDKQIRDKFLAEAMGECWHNTVSTQPYHDNQTTHICGCGARDTVGETTFHKQPWERYRIKITFSTWDGFGKLWNWSKTQEWWADFMSRDVDTVDFYELLIDPDHYADAIYELLAEPGLTSSTAAEVP